MNRAGKLALGCLLFPVALLVILLVVALSIRMAGVPESEVVQTALEQELPATHLERRESTAQEEAVAAEAVRVILELEEGEFEIVPGPAHDGIQVDADYDESFYDLTQDYGVDDEGRPTYHLRLKSRVHWLRRVLASGGQMEEVENYLRIHLPVDTPMDLSLRLAKAECEIDLTGLALVRLEGRLSMGSYSVDVGAANPVPMDRLTLDCSTGEYELDGLSWLGARDMVITGSMGEMRVDLGGPLLRSATLVARMRMGELRLRLPDNALWEGSTSAFLGEVRGRTENPRPVDPEGLRLKFQARVSFGELDVGAYEAGEAFLPRR